MSSGLSRLLRRVLGQLPERSREMDPIAAYDLWSSSYDSQPDNLLIDLDENVFRGLVQQVPITGKVIADVGCGTGRHWGKILERNPARLVGFDSSESMLARLREKYPGAVVHTVHDHRLPATEDQSCDVVISTLALCHLPDAEAALTEWTRVLKPGGDIIITDLHPETTTRASCTFDHDGQTIAVKLYTHALASIRRSAAVNHLAVLRFEEKAVDDSLRPTFEARNAAASFSRMRGVPLIYGLWLKKVPSSAV